MKAGPDRIPDREEVRLLEAASSLLQVQPSDRILVVGSGDGWACRWLALQAADGIVIGVDASDDLVREARATSVSHDNIMYLWAPAEQVPWQENFFTIALYIRSAAAIDNLEKAWSEIGRVLEPGGRLWILGAAEDSTDVLAGLGFEGIHHHDELRTASPRLVSARKPVPPGTGSQPRS